LKPLWAAEIRLWARQYPIAPGCQPQPRPRRRLATLDERPSRPPAPSFRWPNRRRSA